MRARRNDACSCGSGLKYKRCCGADPARQGPLVEVHNAAAFLPALRPAGAAVLRYCSGVADELGENDGSVPDHLVERGVGLVDDADWAAIVSTFNEAVPDVWERLGSIAGQ